MGTFAERINTFNRNLRFAGKLPPGFRLMDPFRENEEVLKVADQFYSKFYDDDHPRNLILGINPGRLGAGATGIPFTDTKRLSTHCGIRITSIHTHEPSSVFMYDVIAEYGGADRFYRDFYINSVCPLGFVRISGRNNEINCNYYDDEALFEAVKPFIIENLKQQIALGTCTRRVIILGKKNGRYFDKINQEHRLFETRLVLDHPRYIEQYKARVRSDYVGRYIAALISKNQALF